MNERKRGEKGKRTNLSVQHAQDLRALIVDNLVLDLVKQDWHSKTAVVVRRVVEIQVPEVGVLLVALERVRHDVLALCVSVLCGWEAPAWVSMLAACRRYEICEEEETNLCHPCASARRRR